MPILMKTSPLLLLSNRAQHAISRALRPVQFIPGGMIIGVGCLQKWGLLGASTAVNKQALVRPSCFDHLLLASK